MHDSKIIQRNYGIDLLRIISMCFVLLLHVLGAGGILNSTEPYSLKYETMWIIESLAYCAVNCYALISGYVGVFSKYRFSNFIVLWIRVLFYSVIITLIMKCFFPQTVGIKAIVCAFFPVFTGQYWYFTAYFVLFLFIPLLNHIIKTFNQRVLFICIIGIIISFSIINPVFDIVFGDVLELNDGYSALWLIVMYLVGGYIRKYGLFTSLTTKILLALYFLSSLLTLVSKNAIQLITKAVFGRELYGNLFVSYTSITVLTAGIFLLLFFEKITIKNRTVIKIINVLSPLSFSVYIIHAQPVLYEMLIKDKFIWITDYATPVMVAVIIGIVIGIFGACCLIEQVRERLFTLLHFKDKLRLAESKLKTKVLK